jgi:hypothetical protein
MEGVHLPTELRLILACLRLRPTEEEARQIARLSRSRIAWPDFLRWVDRHRAAPLVYRNLQSYGREGVPAAALGALRSRFESNARRSLVNAAELVHLCKLFQENGIPVFPLKGSGLALQVYGNLALRHAGDIDLLINPGQVDLADRLLQERYCRIAPGPHLTPYQQKQYNRLREQRLYIHNGNGIKVELHTRFLCNRPHCHGDFDELRDRAQEIAVANASLPVMFWEDNLLYLCDHGAKHYWYRLFWLTDLAEIIRQNWITDWDLIFKTATIRNLSRPLTQGVILAHLLLNVPLPDQIKDYATRDRKMPYLINAALRRIVDQHYYANMVATLYDHLIYCPNLYRNLRYKIESWKRAFLYSKDWGAIPIPDIIFPYFLVLRPLMWFYRRLGAYSFAPKSAPRALPLEGRL